MPHEAVLGSFSTSLLYYHPSRSQKSALKRRIRIFRICLAPELPPVHIATMIIILISYKYLLLNAFLFSLRFQIHFLDSLVCAQNCARVMNKGQEAELWSERAGSWRLGGLHVPTSCPLCSPTLTHCGMNSVPLVRDMKGSPPTSVTLL